MKSNLTVYIAFTCLLRNDMLCDSELTCVSDDIEAIYKYIQNVRKIVIIDRNDPHPSIPDGTYTCAYIEKCTFANERDLDQFINAEYRAPYMMIPYDRIDHRMIFMNKKQSREMMVPAIVADIISRDLDAFGDNLRVTLHSLKEVLYLINGPKVSHRLDVRKDSNTIMHTCVLLDSYLEGDSDVLENALLRRHPILFCDETEYRNRIKIELQHMDLDNQYRFDLVRD